MPEGPPASPASGFVCSDKPAGVTSHDVVSRFRRELGLKAGHAGTLDPFATGLLVILLGSATRLQRYVLGLPKTYVATARLGWRSTTGDPDGELTETGRVPAPGDLRLPTGTIAQRVPMTSAVRVGGERLYRKARRGEDVDRPTREVEIYRADLIGTAGDTATFEIECSAGTYVRTLIEELDDAYCAELRRTAVGELKLADGGSEGAIRPVEDLVAHLPRVDLDPEATRLVRNGIRIPVPGGQPVPGEGPLALIGDGSLVGVATVEADRLRTEVVLPWLPT